MTGDLSGWLALALLFGLLVGSLVLGAVEQQARFLDRKARQRRMRRMIQRWKPGGSDGVG